MRWTYIRGSPAFSVLSHSRDLVKGLYRTTLKDATFEKRRSFINFLIKEVRIERVSPHWVWVQVWWLHEAWGREEKYYHRNVSGKQNWTEEEEAIAREHYAATPRNELMALLPERGWDTITEHCRTHGLRRRIVEAGLTGRTSSPTLTWNSCAARVFPSRPAARR